MSLKLVTPEMLAEEQRKLEIAAARIFERAFASRDETRLTPATRVLYRPSDLEAAGASEDTIRQLMGWQPQE